MRGENGRRWRRARLAAVVLAVLVTTGASARADGLQPVPARVGGAVGVVVVWQPDEAELEVLGPALHIGERYWATQTNGALADAAGPSSNAAVWLLTRDEQCSLVYMRTVDDVEMLRAGGCERATWAYASLDDLAGTSDRELVLVQVHGVTPVGTRAYAAGKSSASPNIHPMPASSVGRG
jgi:hypothetical protein